LVCVPATDLLTFDSFLAGSTFSTIFQPFYGSFMKRITINAQTMSNLYRMGGVSFLLMISAASAQNNLFP
jgi:hypothetical protein